MKALLLTAVIVALLFGLGWMSFVSRDGSASVTIDTDKVKDDTSTAVEKGKEIVEEGLEKLKSKTTDDAPAANETEQPEFEPEAALNP